MRPARLSAVARCVPSTCGCSAERSVEGVGLVDGTHVVADHVVQRHASGDVEFDDLVVTNIVEVFDEGSQ